VPADSTTAATGRNGDLGTSPFFEQLSDKPQLACTCLCVLSDAKRNSGARKLVAETVGSFRPSDKTLWFPAYLGPNSQGEWIPARKGSPCPFP
jgi:hypothetical protein